MPKRTNSAEYPAFVAPYNTEHNSIKEKNGHYYLYRILPGPGPQKEYVGTITEEDGLVPARKRTTGLPGAALFDFSIERAFANAPEGSRNGDILSTDIQVYEYGYSYAMVVLCPKSWRKYYRSDFPILLRRIILEKSPESYVTLFKERELSQERFYTASKQKLFCLLEKEGISESELFEVMSPLKLLSNGRDVRISKVSDRQREFCSRHGITPILGRRVSL